MKKANKRNLTIVLSLVVLICLSAAIFIYIDKHHNNCDQILAEFNKRSETNSLNELDLETAKCMNAF